MVKMGDNPSFSKMRPMAESQRKHVAADDVPFNRVQIITKHGVMEPPGRMTEAMEPMPLMALMPIIEIVIMEQSASDKGRIIEDEVFLFRIKETPLRD